MSGGKWAAPALAIAQALAVIVIVTPGASACGEDPDVQWDADACSGTLAVSVHGDARGSGDCNGAVRCVSVSGTGNATNDVHDGCRSTVGVTCVTASGTGTARNEGSGFSCASDGVAVACLAVSGTGDAENRFGGWDSWSCTATWLAVHASCIAASGTGNASVSTSHYGCGESVTGVTCIAASGTGDAAFHAPWGACSTYGVACVAVSGTGDAHGYQDGQCFGLTCGTCIAPLEPQVEPARCAYG